MPFLSSTLIVKLTVLALILFSSVTILGQGNDRLTPLQLRIEQQRQRLGSNEAEERREALMKLGAMKHPDASRAAVAGLSDGEPMVRATAAHAITSLPGAEAVALLVPQLKDKLEFARREMVFALGETRDRSAVRPLIDLLASEKEISVRAAAVMALGQIRDESAVPALVQVLTGVTTKKKSRKQEDEFVMRSAAQALGQIRSRAGVEILTTLLTNETTAVDVRRAAAEALGLIGDPASATALQAALSSNDPYLSQTAHEALRRLRTTKN